MKRSGQTAALCFGCLNREEPGMRLGHLLKAMRRPRLANGVCPFCAWTEQQLLDTTLCGCPLCYSALTVELRHISDT